MAQLKDTVVSGSLRATDTLYSTTAQFQILKVPSTSGGTDYGIGTAGQVLKTGANGVYWGNDNSNLGTVTSVQVQGTTGQIVSSQNAAKTDILNTTISLADNYGDTKNPYASKTKNTVLAAGATADSVPSFRALVEDDIPNLSASKINGGTFDAARLPLATASQFGIVKIGSGINVNSGTISASTSFTYDANNLVTDFTMYGLQLTGSTTNGWIIQEA